MTYNALRKLDDKHVVFYSVPWHKTERYRHPKDGEADFIVAHPDKGILVLEVKGGEIGYDKVLWRGTPIERAVGVGVTLAYESVDGEEGYPGTLQVEVDYVLNNQDELVIDYRATTDRPTPVNLTKRQKELLREFDGAGKGRSTSPESEGFFSRVKEFWEDLTD